MKRLFKLSHTLFFITQLVVASIARNARLQFAMRFTLEHSKVAAFVEAAFGADAFATVRAVDAKAELAIVDVPVAEHSLPYGRRGGCAAASRVNSSVHVA